MKKRDGFTLWPWLIILVMVGSIVMMLLRLTQQVRERDECRDRMERIHHILTLYEREHGMLPALALFPADPESDEESLVHVLQPYGLKEGRAVCPSSPDVIREHGLSYLWNTALNHQSLHDRLEPTWVLVDLQAMDDRIPGPHFGTYHILYTDGSVERGTYPPPGLPVQFH